MHVIGTAGHVDHGKSTLVQALTGINPDRLREEQEREMTIDLGFAWMTLPNGEPVGIVDVPGHRDFIENMLAGVGGIDAALFVIAADEGVMPQTREHLAILDLLRIPGGVVALTKTDLIDDPDWLELVQADIAEVLQGTVLEGAPIIPVSARTGQGLAELVAALQEVLARTPPRPDRGRPRLWIDRVFTVGGFGTVVTGTLVDGHLEVGQEVEILPRGLRARIRGLQTHKTKIPRAVPGSRVAINLTGVSKQDLARGDLVTVPGWLRSTTLIDARLDVLPDAPFPLKHNIRVKFFCGSAETVARLRLLGTETLAPGQSGWVQLELNASLPLVRGDRFIVRIPSPAATVGGGEVVDPHPGRKHRRFRPEVWARLETLARGTPAEVLLQTLERRGPQTVRDLLEDSGLGEAASSALAELLASGDAVILDAISEPAPARLVAARAWWSATTARMQEELAAYHARYPLRPGMGREGLRSALRLDPRTFNGLIARAAAEGLVADEATTVRLPEHEVRFSPQQQQMVDDLLARFRATPYTPPSVKEAAALVGEEVMSVLLARGDLIQVSPEVLFLRETYREMVERIRAHIQEHGSITLAQVRDLFQTSRKYAQALLEYLDGAGMTRRVGDARVLTGKSAEI
ncbi:MAG: selenocysteine-specific translation elongation factor [Anaerolineae bacterium]|nr:selenocysteine-specific translation elongation factor [Anaerolineae bacterium]MDW8067634.1 selenocysteine-specific translation elongation factor [Anaerolineae bacterium]